MEEQTKNNNNSLGGGEGNNESKKINSAEDKNTTMALIAYILFFVPLLTESKDDPFVKFHVKQGFLLFATAIVISIFSMILPMLMFLGMIAQFGIIVLAIIGIVNAVNGKEEKLPLIGQFEDKVTFL